MMKGCRLVLASSDSWRSQIIRTGWRVCQTSSARDGATGLSSPPPHTAPTHAPDMPTLRRGRPGHYQLQAAISAVHSDAPASADTDWRQILALYDQLMEVAPTPVVALNRCVAVAEVHGPAGALKLAPGLKRESLTGGLLYYDAQTDDARHTLTTVRTAAAYGATVLNSARVIAVLRAGERVVGATVEDVETGERHHVTASVVINCTGVWTDDIQAMAGGRGRFHVRASKGVHIVVALEELREPFLPGVAAQPVEHFGHDFTGKFW